jgi:hypothetical protein
LSNELAVRPETNGDHQEISLFAGATPNEVVAAATQAANALADVIKAKRLYKRIGQKDHVLIEGWQTLGTIVGVQAIADSGVRELPWPLLTQVDEPEDPGAAPREGTAAYPRWQALEDIHAEWRHHQATLRARDMGRAYGFAASFNAVKDGQVVGWGEGRATRAEKRWITAEDYAVASMAQTRGQSRTLRGCLGFVVSLAGYAPTPAEEADDSAPESPPNPAPAHPFGPVADEFWKREALIAVRTILDGEGADEFLRLLGNSFDDGLPECAARTLKGLAWWLDSLADPAASAADVPDASTEE